MVKRSTKSGVDKAKKPAKAKTAKAPPPPEKPATTQAEINRIGDIIRNARGTWFGLLGALVFAAVTLASVKDASFFIPSEQTKLPLLGISVPITSFFWAGALLVTALYTYLHLYLVQLWDALGDADPQFKGKPLADVIHPWLVSDAALRVRDQRRKAKDNEHCSRKRGMSMVSTLVSILLVWFFGLITIGWFWWRSMPAHDIWLTGWLGALFAWSLYVFWRSSSYALEHLSKEKSPLFPKLILYGACLLVIGGLSYVRTHYDIWEGYPRIDRDDLVNECTENQKDIQNRKICGYFLNLTQELLRPARAEMAETVFTQKPSSWKGYDLAKQEYRQDWCKQIVDKVCEINPMDENPLFDEKVEEKFEEAWKSQLKATLATFSKPDLKGKRLEGADLRDAQLEGVRLDNARLQGANLRNSQLQGADLTETKMQGADLFNAEMQGAGLRRAEMQGADLSFAEMQGAILFEAEMQGANLSFAKMQGANLTAAKMQGANLWRAQMQGANLWRAQMQGADLTEAKMQEADLRRAQMQEAILADAKMQGANLRGAEMQRAHLKGAEMQGAELTFAVMQRAILADAKMQGTPEKKMKLQSTNLEQANFSTSSLRFVDFTGAYVVDLRNFEKSFGDKSVNLAGLLKKPDGWCESVLSDEQYWGRYQGWQQKHGSVIGLDREITKFPLIPFGTPCPE